MASVQINSKVKVGFDELVKGFSKLETSDIENFVLEITNIIAKRKAASLSKRESELFLTINKTWTPAKKKRFDLLTKKLQEEKMTAKEHTEYLKLIDLKQERAVKRLESLTELAQLRKVSLRKLMEQLGLNVRPANHA